MTKRVIFPLVLDGCAITYPDEVSLFSDTDLDYRPGYVVANYNGELDLQLWSDRREQIKQQLADIDAATTKPRTIREMQLGNAAAIAWVQQQDELAATLRAELRGLL